MFSIVTSRLLTPHNGRSLTSVRCCEALSVYVYGWWLAAISGLCAGAFGAGFLVVAPGVGRIVFFSCHSGLACHSIAASPCGLPVPAPPYVPHCAMVARQHDGSCASRVVSLVRVGTAACVYGRSFCRLCIPSEEGSLSPFHFVSMSHPLWGCADAGQLLPFGLYSP